MTDFISRLLEPGRQLGWLAGRSDNREPPVPLLLRRYASSHHAISLVDQAIVSGTSFLTIVALARWGNSRELGAYIIAATLVVSAAAFQDSLILQPYTVYCASESESNVDRVGASFAVSAAFAIIISMTIILASVILKQCAIGAEIYRSIFTAGAITPFVLAREFARRSSFAHMKFQRAMLVDSCVAILQIGWLSWLGAGHYMSATNVWIGIGIANGFCVACWLYLVRSQILIQIPSLRSTFGKTWSLGKWLLLGRVAVQIQSYVVYWIVFAISGPGATGVYTACSSLVNLANPLVLAISNVMMPKMSLSWRIESGSGLSTEATRNAVLTGVPLLFFVVFLWGGGARTMSIIYRGTEYVGHRDIVVVLALALLVASVGSPASFGLAVMERPRAVVAAATLGALATVVAVWSLTKEWGLSGAAFGLLTGSACGAFARWMLFYALLPPRRSYDAISDVVRQFTSALKPISWCFSRVGSGEQADVFIIQFSDRQHGHEAVAIKLYRREQVTSAEVRAQFVALSRLYQGLNHRQSGDWQIVVPRPLFVCESPLALVMTVVPGEHLEIGVSHDAQATTRGTVGRIAEAFALAMQRYWRIGGRHADLGMRNILVDLESKKISLVDAGTRGSCPVCNNLHAFPSHVATDLAHVLRDAVRDITDILGQPKGRVIKELFAEHVIRVTLESIPVAKERQESADEIMRCLVAHLDECLDISWSLKGITHRLVRIIALNRARAVLGRVVGQCDRSEREAAVVHGCRLQ